MFFKGGGKIGQTNRLRPDGGLIEIPNGWLNEKDFHDFYQGQEIILNPRPIVYF
jgi:hypothetical protein